MLNETVRLEIVVIGKESAGKSQLISSLTGGNAASSSFRGSTIAVESYRAGDITFLDTPGLWRQSDAATTAAALSALDARHDVLLVIQATQFDRDLAELLPVARDKRAAVAVTFWDKVENVPDARESLDGVARDIGIPIVPLDARRLDETAHRELNDALRKSTFPAREKPTRRAGWHIEPRRGPLEYRFFGPLFALLLLFLPAVFAVYAANGFAGAIEPIVQNLATPITNALKGAPFLIREILIGHYGLITMGPLLFVWAAPTVILYAVFLGIYKASGLVERAAIALHPLFRPAGLSGRDLIRVVMGWGCNVPAVIATRSCSGCSRGACVGAIAYGAACSYQFGATLSVFAAAQKPFLIWPYLAYLGMTTLLYTRLTSSREARSKSNLLLIESRNFLSWPTPGAVWREARSVLRAFFAGALPIFFAVTVVASLLDAMGVLKFIAAPLSPLMGAFRLPADAMLPVIVASIRKDGILLLSNSASQMSSSQLLTAVYLAGVLLPCLVTALTTGREMGARFLGKMLLRQISFAIFATLILAWLIPLVLPI